MSCEGCESTVEEALTAVPGVDSADADSTTDSVTVTGAADRDELVAAVEDAGYEVPDASA